MTTMTETQMVGYIKSNNYTAQTIRAGSEAYIAQLGLFRVMFKFDGDPKLIITLKKGSKREVWIKDLCAWEQVH